MATEQTATQEQHCDCGRTLPIAQAQHVYDCPCGKLWLRADCSEVCEGWIEY